MKRQATLASAETSPSWNVIANHVVLQIATHAANSVRLLTAILSPPRLETTPLRARQACRIPLLFLLEALKDEVPRLGHRRSQWRLRFGAFDELEGFGVAALV